MSCANCGHALRDLPNELDVYAADGSVHTLPRAFCPACGWPLGRPQVSLRPGAELSLSGDQPAEISVVVANDGDGALYYSLEPDPRLRPLSLPTLHGTVDAGSRREIVLRLAPDAVDAAEHLDIDVYTLGGLPDILGAARNRPVDELWQQQTVGLDVVRLQAGPLAVDAEHVLFGLGTDEAYVNVLNFGGLALDADLVATQGYLVCGDVGAGFGSSARATLRPGRPQDPQRPRPEVTAVRVRAPEDAGLPPGQLTISAAGQPPLVVRLERVMPQPPAPPECRYAVGIDFGTSKTAVAWVDQWSLPPKVQMLEWDRVVPGADRRWLPSALFYDRTYGQPVFGDAAFVQSGANISEVGVRLSGHGRLENANGTLFVGMKMHLRDTPDEAAGPNVQQVAADYFRFLFTALQKAGVDLRQALVVLSLPVLHDAAEYQRQEDRTRQAALQAGALFGIGAGQLQFEKEPVCAAIDLVRGAGDAGATSLESGDWLCVFDSGAGTTDLSLCQVALQDDTWRFAQIEPLGYEFGGDALDEWIFGRLLALWCNPDDPSTVPSTGPLAIRPLKEPPTPPIDADAPPTAPPPALDWWDWMSRQDAYRFHGSAQSVTRSELLGLVSHFKETYLTVAGGAPATDLTTETPLLPLGPDRRGGRGPWAKLPVDELVRLISLEFGEMRDAAGVPLRVKLPTLFASLGLLKPQHVCPVGGGTLVRGWREAVEREPLGMTGIMADELGLRRLHVARGAAQRALFKVADRLPEAARLQVCEWVPGRPPKVVQEQVLAAGSPPGERQQAQVVANLSLQPGARLLFRVLLGERVLRQAPVSWYDGRLAVEARGLGRQVAVRLQGTLRYLRAEPRLELRVVWLIEGEPAAAEPSEVKLPRFEE